MEYRQFLKSLVPESATLKAETVQNAFLPPPVKTPAILTDSLVHVMASAFRNIGLV
jgi:hypothetical protein